MSIHTPHHTLPCIRAFLLGCSLLAATTTTNAQSIWSGASNDLWTNSGNWNTAPGSGANVVFDGTGSNLDTTTGTAFTLNSLTFTSGQTAAVTINTTPTNSITFNPGTVLSVAAGQHKLQGPATPSTGTNRELIFTGTASTDSYTLDIASGASFEINGRIGQDGNGGPSRTYTKTGAGTLIFSVANGGSGAWNFSTAPGSSGFLIDEGVLRFTATNAGGLSRNRYTVSAGAALELTGGIGQTLSTGTGVNAGTNGGITINGTGIGGTGAIRSLIGNNNFNSDGFITLASNSSIGVDAGALTISLAVGESGGARDLTKVGAGTLTLTGFNTYTGDTLVNAGTLIVNGSMTSDTTVASGGTLMGSGTTTGTVTVQSGGTLASGTSIESFASGTVSLASGSTFEYEIDRSVALAVGGDLTAISGNLNITSGAILTITDLGLTGTWSLGDKLTLMSYSGSWNNGLFTYDSQTLNNFDTFTLSGVEWLFRYDDNLAGGNFTDDLTTGGGFVTMTVIPEPSTALLGGLGCLMLLRRRR